MTFYNRLKPLSVLFLLHISLGLSGQTHAWLEGYVTSSEGDTLPYAHIFSNTSLEGTSTNENGKYVLKLQPGIHELSVQYIGFKNTERTLQINPGERIQWDIQLSTQNVEIREIVIKGDRNPGNEIIQKVINRRRELLSASENYETNVYIKGNYRIKDAPDKFFGQETGGIDSLKAVLRSDIIYLSETNSVFTKFDGKQKELIKGSRTSGMKSLPSINNAALLDLNFYQNHPELIGKPIKSPVADDAFQHYTYKLVGIYDYTQDQKVYQIQFRPKRRVDPLLEGTIEILDSIWMIASLNAYCDGKDIKIELADSIHIKQIFHPVKGSTVWPVLQTEIFMELSALGFKASGGFTGIYNNYTFEPDSFTNQMDRTQLKYDSAALEKDTLFWNEKRPIELTEEEKKDFQIKDSVATELNSPEHLDSLEREANKLSLTDLIIGYEYKKRESRIQFNFTSPLNYLGFNPVQGFNTYTDIGIIKDWGRKKNFFKLKSMAQIGYGFSDMTWRYKGKVSTQWNEYDPLQISLEAGQSLLQVNNDNPISLNANEFSNLFFKNHYIRFYESRRGELTIKKDFQQGVTFTNSLILEQRSMVENTTQYSVFREDRIYQENIPVHEDLEGNILPYEENRIFKLKSNLIYQPGITYLEFPNFRMAIPSVLPVFTVQTDWGIPMNGFASNYFRVEGQIDYQLEIGISGTSSWTVKAGGFLWQDQLTFFDYKHFSGNQFFWGDADYTKDFMVLPYYNYSTNHPYAEVHWTHDFESFLLNKVPYVRNLGFSLISKVSYLHHKDIGHYNEISIGLDRIGWGIFRLFRVDVTAAFQNGEYRDWGILIGSRFNLSDLQAL